MDHFPWLYPYFTFRSFAAASVSLLMQEKPLLRPQMRGSLLETIGMVERLSCFL
jgi:hypothetical protein